MRHLLAWLADITLGPACPHPNCSHRARGWRTLHHHITTNHPNGASR
jgi:hypothetical protein